MASRKESDNLPERPHRGRKPKPRGRLRRSCARFQIEHLETRVLLFSGPINVPFPVSPLSVESPQALVSSTAFAPIVVGRDVTIFPAALESANSEIALINPANLTASIEVASPTVFVVSPDPAHAYLLSGANQEGWWQGATQTSGPSTLVVEAQGAGTPVGVAGGLHALDQLRYDRMMLIQTDNASYDSGISVNANAPTLAPGPYPALGGQLGPIASRISTEGSGEAPGEAGKPFLPLAGPGEPGFETIAFIAHGAGDPGSAPYLQTDGSADSMGGVTTGAQSGVAIGLPSVPMQFLNVALRTASVSARLLGKLSSSSSAPTSESGTTGVASTSPSGPFVSSVQRQDDQDTASAASAPAQGVLAIGMTPFSASSSALAPATIDSVAQRALETTADASFSTPEPAAIVLANLEETSTGAEGGFDSRILTGPLASRTAGPLGPILASIGADPTPEVDRAERALSQVIERGESEAGNEYLSEQTTSIQGAAGESSGSVGIVAGAGGFPLMVTSIPRSRSTELHGLLLSIREGTRFADTRQEAADASRLIDASQNADPAQDRDDARGLAIFLKAACGIALGVGMSSRVLFPALVSGAQKRLRRLRRKL